MGVFVLSELHINLISIIFQDGVSSLGPRTPCLLSCPWSVSPAVLTAICIYLIFSWLFLLDFYHQAPCFRLMNTTCGRISQGAS